MSLSGDIHDQTSNNKELGILFDYDLTIPFPSNSSGPHSLKVVPKFVS